MTIAKKNPENRFVPLLSTPWLMLLVLPASLLMEAGYAAATAAETAASSTVIIASPAEALPVIKLIVNDEPASTSQTQQSPTEPIPAEASAAVPEPVPASATAPARMTSAAPIAPRALLPEPSEDFSSGRTSGAAVAATPLPHADSVPKLSLLPHASPVPHADIVQQPDPAPLEEPVRRTIPVQRPELLQQANSFQQPQPVPPAEPVPQANPAPQEELARQADSVQRFVPFPVPAPSPVAYGYRCGVVCADGARSLPFAWRGKRPIPWEAFAQGEYVGPARLAHVPEYRLRVDDQLDFVYIFSVRPSARPYRLNVRDRIRIESLVAPDVVDREVLVQPDGTVTLRLLGQVLVAGLTIQELREELNKRYVPHIANPSITVTPIEVNSYLQELRYSVDRRYGIVGGQGTLARVTPEGTVQLPIIGSVPVQGLTLNEVKREIEQRYSYVAEGIEVTPILANRAPRYFFILGEVRNPGRFTMEGPTTVMQAIAMAGSWSFTGNIKQVVVLRRDDNWCLMATKLNLHAALYGKQPCPRDEIWLRDSDTVIVPKTAIETADEFIEQVFTRGIYGVVPVLFGVNFAKMSTI